MEFPEGYQRVFSGSHEFRTRVEQLIPTTNPDGYIVEISEECAKINPIGSITTNTFNVFLPQSVVDYLRDTVLLPPP